MKHFLILLSMCIPSYSLGFSQLAENSQEEPTWTQGQLEEAWNKSVGFLDSELESLPGIWAGRCALERSLVNPSLLVVGEPKPGSRKQALKFEKRENHLEFRFRPYEYNNDLPGPKLPPNAFDTEESVTSFINEIQFPSKYLTEAGTYASLWSLALRLIPNFTRSYRLKDSSLKDRVGVVSGVYALDAVRNDSSDTGSTYILRKFVRANAKGMALLVQISIDYSSAVSPYVNCYYTSKVFQPTADQR